jgi:hypothetical protein
VPSGNTSKLVKDQQKLALDPQKEKVSKMDTSGQARNKYTTKSTLSTSH